MTTSQRKRFQALQQNEDDGTLSSTEQTELAEFVQQIEADEAAYLGPATVRIRQQRLRLEEQNEALRTLIRRKERLARRIERVLTLSASERRKINAQQTAILNASSARTAP